MERYIGLLKSKVSLMSDVDTEMANKATLMECLNHLPPAEYLGQVSKNPTYTDEFPHPPPDNRMAYSKRPPPEWLSLLRNYYKKDKEYDLKTYPITPEHLHLWKKYWIRYGCFVGSDQSQKQTHRDDSYVWWERGNSGKREFGQVLIFAIAHDWEAIAIVKPFKWVKEHKSGNSVALPSMGRMEPVKATEIGGLVGRIARISQGKKMYYLVGNWK
jgi:hypothetical protein